MNTAVKCKIDRCLILKCEATACSLEIKCRNITQEFSAANIRTHYLTKV